MYVPDIESYKHGVKLQLVSGIKVWQFHYLKNLFNEQFK